MTYILAIGSHLNQHFEIGIDKRHGIFWSIYCTKRSSGGMDWTRKWILISNKMATRGQHLHKTGIKKITTWAVIPSKISTDTEIKKLKIQYRSCIRTYDNGQKDISITYICNADPATGTFAQLEIVFTLSSVKLLTRMLLYNRDKLSNPTTYFPSPAPRPHNCEEL